MIDEARYRMSETPAGGLSLFEMPAPNRDYILGVDTAGGGPESDYCAGIVIEAETCGVVASWHERMDATPWGLRMACLGWLFNEALLAFEVYPSAHGATALSAARSAGYARIYQRQQLDSLGRPTTKILGWRTDSQTKPQMIERVKDALRDGAPIPSEALLAELRTIRWDPKKPTQLHRKVRDDLFVAYSIALLVRDNAWTRGLVRSKPWSPKTDSERFWASRENMGQRRRRIPSQGL